jgi:hypothetical protein
VSIFYIEIECKSFLVAVSSYFQPNCPGILTWKKDQNVNVTFMKS